jgi:hypothetical protein
MANEYYDGEGFGVESLLVEVSLTETLLRLEEHHWGLRVASLQMVDATLAWLMTRASVVSGRLKWQRSEYDRAKTGGYARQSGGYERLRYVKLPTGEDKINQKVLLAANIAKIASPDNTFANVVREQFLSVYPGGANRREMLENGRFCCGSCTAQFQRALRRVDPSLYLEYEDCFLRDLRAKREGGNRWRGYPFYYTILCLDDIGTDLAAEELAEVAQKVRPNLALRYTDESRLSRFRKGSLDRLAKYAKL